MTRLEGKLDEVMGRFQQIAPARGTRDTDRQRVGQIYDQASQDLTQGR